MTLLHQPDLEALLRESGQAHLAPTIRPARALTAVRHKARSRFGGTPDLPEGHPWPIGTHGHLTFLGQLDLVELGGASLGLPSRGLLSFFYDTVHQPSPGAAPDLQVLHLDDEQLGAIAVPDEFAGEELGAMHVGGTPTWTVRLGTPPPSGASAWLELLERLDPRRAPAAWLGGQAYPLQEAMESECARVHPATPPDGWGLLLQLDSDFIPDVRWGSGSGRLYVFAPRDAMRACDFRDAVGFVQDT